MNVTAVKTDKILPGQKDIFKILDQALTHLGEKSIVIVTSKIVALCENRVEPVDGTDKEALIKRESDLFLPSTLSRYGYHFTITDNTLISVAGIDESNSGGDYYVLWPDDLQKSANDIRRYLRHKFNLKDLGVVISDSTCLPLRWGTFGIPLSYSGFRPTNDYIGTPDLFGRPFKVSKSGVALGLTAAAVVVMGEGTEQTPMAVIDDIPFVEFQENDPTAEDLENFYISNWREDLFEPFLGKADWQKGKRSQE
jgi:F420-0:gamma-glutamyl ligase